MVIKTHVAVVPGNDPLWCAGSGAGQGQWTVQRWEVEEAGKRVVGSSTNPWEVLKLGNPKSPIITHPEKDKALPRMEICVDTPENNSEIRSSHMQ